MNRFALKMFVSEVYDLDVAFDPYIDWHGVLFAAIFDKDFHFCFKVGSLSFQWLEQRHLPGIIFC